MNLVDEINRQTLKSNKYWCRKC